MTSWNVGCRSNLVDYLRSGWKISISGAIDYTISNGYQDNEYSLHYLDDKNQYEAAIRNVGEVIEPYDSDSMFPFYGFGGCPNNSLFVSHCFPLNGNEKDPEIESIYGVVDAYRNSLKKI